MEYRSVRATTGKPSKAIFLLWLFFKFTTLENQGGKTSSQPKNEISNSRPIAKGNTHLTEMRWWQMSPHSQPKFCLQSESIISSMASALPLSLLSYGKAGGCAGRSTQGSSPVSRSGLSPFTADSDDCSVSPTVLLSPPFLYSQSRVCFPLLFC